MSSTVCARGVGLLYGYRAIVQGIDLEAGAGECVLLLGHNGAGKSTLLKLVSTLASPTSGELNVLGAKLPEEAAVARRKLGYLGHEPQLYPGLTALENLRFAARLHGLKFTEAELLERLRGVSLDLVALQPVRSYSRGMLQRLALIRTLLHDPELLLLDEPFTGLDVEGRRACMRLLDMARGQGKTILLTTHQLEEVYAGASQVLVLAQGRTVLKGTPQNLPQERVLGLLGGSSS